MIKEIGEKYFDEYHKLVGHKIDTWLTNYDFNDRGIELGYSTKASAVYSSNIEGNTVDLNTYMNHELAKHKFNPSKEIEEIDNLVKAYEYAQQTSLNETTFLKCHSIFSKTLLIKSKLGKYREEKVGVFGEKGLAYLAVEPEFVNKKMNVFFNEVSQLLTSDMSEAQVFYYASLVHLVFVHIHPFMDGNGRGARLLEKWFICQKLGARFWNLSSEKYYKDNRNDYYNNINLGVNYYELDYDKCLPFLCMLPLCLE